jgi:hypothetical protein
MHHPIKRQILEQVNDLPYVEQRKVLNFARALGQAKPAGVSWDDLCRFAGTIDKADLRRMADAIEEGCERIDINEW